MPAVAASRAVSERWARADSASSAPARSPSATSGAVHRTSSRPSSWRSPASAAARPSAGRSDQTSASALHRGDVRGDVRVQPLEVDRAKPSLELGIVAADARDPGADRGQVDRPDAPRRQGQAFRQHVEGGVHAPEAEQDVPGQGGEVLPEPPLEARLGRGHAAGFGGQEGLVEPVRGGEVEREVEVADDQRCPRGRSARRAGTPPGAARCRRRSHPAPRGPIRACSARGSPRPARRPPRRTRWPPRRPRATRPSGRRPSAHRPARRAPGRALPWAGRVARDARLRDARRARWRRRRGSTAGIRSANAAVRR